MHSRLPNGAYNICRSPSLRLTALLLLTAAATQAQPLSCESLRKLTNFDFSVITAQTVAASPDTPAHCRVTGQILPEIRFQLALPVEWNKRFLMLGNGGYAGTMDTRGMLRSAGMGYAAAITDTGHNNVTEPLATFAVNSQKLLDYGFRSLHTTALASKSIIAVYYGAAPSKSYFQGCSTGGRQALILAQRFPDDFDGIIAGAPVLNWSGTMLRYLASMRAFAESPIPYSKMPLLAEHVYQQCDAKDGLADGVIDDPRQCGFSPSRDLPKCAGAEEAGCFTSGQIHALEVFYSPVMSSGKPLFPGWPVGAEIAGPNGKPGWDEWFVTRSGPTTAERFSTAFLKYMAFGIPDPTYDLAKFNFDQDPQRMDWIRSVLDAADPDLTGFRERRGRLLMYFGWADPALNAQMGVDYYESVQKKMGSGVTDFFRFYTVPGMFHCFGGVGCDRFDMLAPLVDWVEQGKVPERILASKVVAGKTVRTRPLCPYPQAAKYKGSGSTDDAANFACAQ